MLSGDRIILQGLQFFGYHGALPQERDLGQKFVIDLELVLDLKKAGASDDLEDTVNYALIYDLVKEVATGKPYNLIEAVAEDIAGRIIGHFCLQQVKVTVKKPCPPVPGILDYVAVQVIRGGV